MSNGSWNIHVHYIVRFDPIEQIDNVTELRIELSTGEPLYCGHHWDPSNCPDFRGVLNSGVVLYRIATIGTKASVHIKGVSALRGSTG